MLTPSALSSSARRISNSVGVSSSGSALPAHAHAVHLDLDVAVTAAAVRHHVVAHDAEQRVDARDQKIQRHRLGLVVPGAELQTVDAVELVATAGQEQHRQTRAARLQETAHVETAADVAAEHDVQNCQVRQRVGERRQRRFTIGVFSDGVTLGA